MTAGMSSYKKQQGQQTPKDKSCSKCGNPSHGKDGVCPAANEKCRKCDRVGHYGRVCRSKKDYQTENAMMVEDLYYLQDKSGSGNFRGGSTSPGKPGKGEHKILPHMVFQKRLGRYVAKKGGSTNRMDLQITLDKGSFER